MGLYVYDDGGRSAAGYRGWAGDCVVRAIAIAAEIPYRDVYAALSRPGNSARDGVLPKIYKEYLADLGWTWAATMQIGSGVRVHLRGDELPGGRIIARCSKHLVAVIDGVIHDTHDPSRDGTRAVYGYWTKEGV